MDVRRGGVDGKSHIPSSGGSPMTTDAVGRFVRLVMMTQDAEPDLDAAEAALALMVDARLQGKDVSATLEWLAPHLAQSPETADQLDTLSELARLEATTGLPDAEASLAALRGAPPYAPRAGGRDLAAGDLVGAIGGLVRGWQRDLAARRIRLGGAFSGTRQVALLGAAPVLGLALLAAVGGWWQADHRADRSAARIALLEDLVQTGVPVQTRLGAGIPSPAGEAQSWPALSAAVGSTGRVRGIGDGEYPWVIALFAPTGRRALVSCGELAVGGSAADLEWWSITEDGSRQPVRILEHLAGRTHWWLIEALREMSAYHSLQLERSSGGESVVSVDLDR